MKYHDLHRLTGTVFLSGAIPEYQARMQNLDSWHALAKHRKTRHIGKGGDTDHADTDTGTDSTKRLEHDPAN